MFDILDHSILLDKTCVCRGCPSMFGFEIIYHEVNTSNVSGVLSNDVAVTLGAPQDSIPDLVVFLLLINKFSKNVNLCGTSMYADETANFYTANLVDDVSLST